MKIALFCVFLLVALVHLWACFFRLKKLRMLTKPLVMAMLIPLYCVLAGSPHPLVIAAQAFGLVGDLLLLFPKRKACFFTGASSFAAGHVCYGLVLFFVVLKGLQPRLLLLPGLPLLLGVFCLVAAASLPLIKVLHGPLIKLAPAYASLICIFLAGALTGLSQALPGTPLLAVGSALFLTSDVLLCYQEFKAETPRGNFFVMLTYIAAQALLALGFAGV